MISKSPTALVGTRIVMRLLRYLILFGRYRTAASEEAAPPRPIERDSTAPHSPSLGSAEPAPLRGTASDEDPPDAKEATPEPSGDEKDEQGGGLSEPKKLG